MSQVKCHPKSQTPYYIWSVVDLKIIEFVKQNPIIYDQRYNPQRRKIIKELWTEFAARMGTQSYDYALRWLRIVDVYRKTIKRQKYKPRLFSKYYDGTLSFLKLPGSNIMNGPSFKSTTEMTHKPSSTNIEKKITVVTQDMIEEMIRLKTASNDMNNPDTQLENISDASRDASNSVCSNDEACSAPKLFSTIAETITCDEDSDSEDDGGIIKEAFIATSSIRSHKSILSEPSLTEVPLVKLNAEDQSQIIPTSSEKTVSIFDAYGIKITTSSTHISLTPDHRDLSTTKNPQSADQSEKVTNDQKFTTIDFFEDMGKYVSKHFPEKQQKQLRLMLWSLITQEELEMLREE